MMSRITGRWTNSRIVDGRGKLGCQTRQSDGVTKMSYAARLRRDSSRTAGHQNIPYNSAVASIGMVHIHNEHWARQRSVTGVGQSEAQAMSGVREEAMFGGNPSLLFSTAGSMIFPLGNDA